MCVCVCLCVCVCTCDYIQDIPVHMPREPPVLQWIQINYFSHEKVDIITATSAVDKLNSVLKCQLILVITRSAVNEVYLILVF